VNRSPSREESKNKVGRNKEGKKNELVAAKAAPGEWKKMQFAGRISCPTRPTQ